MDPGVETYESSSQEGAAARAQTGTENVPSSSDVSPQSIVEIRVHTVAESFVRAVTTILADQRLTAQDFGQLSEKKIAEKLFSPEVFRLSQQSVNTGNLDLKAVEETVSSVLTDAVQVRLEVLREIQSEFESYFGEIPTLDLQEAHRAIGTPPPLSTRRPHSATDLAQAFFREGGFDHLIAGPLANGQRIVPDSSYIRGCVRHFLKDVLVTHMVPRRSVG